MTAGNYTCGYSVSRTVVPLLIVALPIMAMIAWIMYQVKADMNMERPAVSVPAAPAEPNIPQAPNVGLDPVSSG